MNMKTFAALLALALLACLSWRWTSDRGAEPAARGDDRPADSPEKADVAGPRNVGSVELIDDGPIPVWAQPDFIQGYNLYYYARKLEVVDQRPDPTTGVWQQATYVGFASFKVSDAATARDDRFALAGWAGANDDEFVIERWKLATARVQALPVGGTAPLFPVKNFVRTEIYRGPLGTTLRGFEFDAELRYMLAVLEDASGLVSLYQFPNQANATPVVVADSNTYPELASVRHIQKFDHPVVGRQVEAYWELPSTFSLMFIDTDNDGLFDGAPIIGEWSYLESIGLKGYETRDLLQGPGA